jgi:hypothetical protein
MGRIRPMAPVLRAWWPAARGASAHLFPGPRPKWLGLLHPTPGRGSAAWPASALADAARTGCTVTMCVARAVVRPAAARWRRHALGVRSPRARHARWCGRQRLAGGQGVARSWVRAPQLSGGCAGQGDQRRGLPQ